MSLEFGHRTEQHEKRLMQFCPSSVVERTSCFCNKGLMFTIDLIEGLRQAHVHRNPLISLARHWGPRHYPPE